MNDLWRVESDAGTFVLKRTHIERYVEHTRREHRVLQHLCRDGWSVPAPVPASDGNTLVRIDERTWWLTPWLPGRQPRVTERSTHRLGTVLARLHLSLVPLVDDPRLEGDFGAREVRSRAVARHGWTFVEAMNDLERAEPALGHRLKAEVDRLEDQLARTAPGPAAVCHGDLHAGNLLVHRGTTSVLDFDFTHVQERAADVATSIALVDLPLAPALVAGYESVMPLSDDERAALPLLFDARLLHHVAWTLWRWSNGEKVTDELVRTLDRLRSLRLQSREVIAPRDA